MLSVAAQPQGGAALLRDGEVIGRAALQGDVLEQFTVDAPFRCKGYGTWFFKQLMRLYHIPAQQPLWAFAEAGDAAAAAFLHKFGFCAQGTAGLYCRSRPAQVNALSIAHDFLRAHVRSGAFAIDATAGNGHDTAFLCELVGSTGRVLALDIQPAAAAATGALLREKGFAQGRAVCASHAELARFAAPGTADAIVFNLGYLPGGDHTVFTTPEESIPALRTSLELLAPGGVLTVCAYSGKAQGTAERDAVLRFARALPARQYAVSIELFSDRAGLPPIPICVEKCPAEAK